MIKYIPYRSWEPDAVETWLTDQAAKGWELVDITLHFGQFRRTAPKRVRYRLDRQVLGRLTRAEAEYLALCKESGWDFVCNLGDCYVLRTEDENAVEIQSDPALYLEGLEKALRGKIGWSVFILILLGFAIAGLVMFFRRDGIAYRLVELGFLSFVNQFVFCLAAALLFPLEIVTVIRIKKRIKDGTVDRHFHRSPRAARLRAVLVPLLILTLILDVVHPGYSNIHRGDSLSDEVIAALPFATLRNIDPAGAAKIAAQSREPHSELKLVSYDYCTYRNLPMPAYYSVSETIDTWKKAGVNQYETVSRTGCAFYYRKLWSENLARDYLSDRLTLQADGCDYETIAYPGFDEVWYGLDADSNQSLWLRRGDTLLEVYSLDSADLREYLDIFAEKLS